MSQERRLRDQALRRLADRLRRRLRLQRGAAAWDDDGVQLHQPASQQTGWAGRMWEAKKKTLSDGATKSQGRVW